MEATSLDAVAAGNLVFSSSFDGGNAARVEAVEDDSFALWTRRDCEGTEFETGCRTWFSFSVRGAAAGRTLKFAIHNMNFVDAFGSSIFVNASLTSDFVFIYAITKSRIFLCHSLDTQTCFAGQCVAHTSWYQENAPP